jgi:hypothetical protein
MSTSHQPRSSKTGILSLVQRGIAAVLAGALLNATNHCARTGISTSP